MSYEDQGSGFDPGAAAHERQGRRETIAGEWTNEVDRLADAARQGASGRKILPPWHLIDRWEQERWREAVRYVLAAQAALKNVANGR